MAKIKQLNTIQTELENEKSEYERWVPDTHQKDIPLNKLEHHPENFNLVGHIDKSTKESLKEDIQKNGIREPLQVIYSSNKLYVVSGNERLIILKELKFKTAPCIKKDFNSKSEELQHIYATNKNRKNVKIPGPELLETLFPPAEYPLLYKDLRGNYSYNKSNITGGNITPKNPQNEIETRRKARKNLIKKASKLTGQTEKTVKKNISNLKKKIKNKPSTKQKRKKLPPVKKRKLETLEKKLSSYNEKLLLLQEKIKETKKEISKLLKSISS